MVLSCSMNAQQLENIDSLFRRFDKLYKQDSFSQYLKEVNSLDYKLAKRNTELFLKIEAKLDSLYLNVKPNQIDSFELRVRYYNHASNIKNATNNYYNALDFYLKAHLLIKDKEKLDRYTRYNEKQIGDIYARFNDYDLAIYYYKLYERFLLLQGDSSQLSRLYVDIGKTYDWLGNKEEAIYYLDESLRLGELNHQYKSIQSNHLYRAESILEDAFKRDDPVLDTAYLHIIQSRKALEKIDTSDRSFKSRDYGIDLAHLNFLLLKRDSLNVTLSIEEILLKSKKAYNTKRSRERAKVKLQLVNLLLKFDPYNEKILFLIDASLNDLMQSNVSIALNEMNLMENTFADVYYTKSKLYKALFEKNNNIELLDSALIQIDKAIESNNILNEKLLLDNSKYISIETDRRFVDLAIEVCYLKKENNSQTFNHDEVRYYFNLSKAIIITNKLKERISEKEYSEFDQKNLDSLRLEMSKMVLNDSLESNLIVENVQKQKTIISKYGKIKTEFQSSKIPYVEYVSTNDYLYSLEDINGINFRRIGNIDSINHVIGNIIISIEHKSDLLKSVDLKDLSTLLFPKQFSSKKVRIISDGLLHYLPFDILLYNKGYLIESKIVINDFHHNKIKKNKKGSGELSIYCLLPQYKINSSQLASRSEIGYLPYAQKEVAFLKKNYGKNIKVVNQFDNNEFLKEITNYSVFHYSGHAQVKGNNSYLILDDYGKKLYGEQIAKLNSNLDMVVLSACETGLGEFKYGEGIKSLASSFLSSGANSILYSLWKVNDQSTSEIIKEFYTNLDKGQTKSEALKNAKINFINTASPQFNHPYHWAGLTLVNMVGYESNLDYWKWFFWICFFLFIFLIAKWKIL